MGVWLERLHRDLVLKTRYEADETKTDCLVRLGGGCSDVFSMEGSLKSLTAGRFLCFGRVNTKNAGGNDTRTG